MGGENHGRQVSGLWQHSTASSSAVAGLVTQPHITQLTNQYGCQHGGAAAVPVRAVHQHLASRRPLCQRPADALHPGMWASSR